MVLAADRPPPQPMLVSPNQLVAAREVLIGALDARQRARAVGRSSVGGRSGRGLDAPTCTAALRIGQAPSNPGASKEQNLI